ncbi:MAG: hypothetical protein AAB465_00595 [Patescibacteria group bacterium]
MENDLEITQPSLAPETAPAETKKRRIISVKLLVIIAIVIVIGVLGFYFKGLFIAATVNGSPISRYAVIAALEKVSGAKALDSFIVQRLIDNEASKKGITVSSDELNTEIKIIDDQIKAQGGTLNQVLAAQSVSREDFIKQIITQKKLENLIAADKIQVVDSEIEQYIQDNKIKIPNGEEAEYKSQLKKQMRQQKLSDAAMSLIDSLRSQAKIKYFIKY